MDSLRGIGFILIVIVGMAIFAFGGTVLAAIGFIATLALIGAAVIGIVIAVAKGLSTNTKKE